MCSDSDVDRLPHSRTRIPVRPFCSVALKATWKPAGYPKQINNLGDHIRRRRLDSGLLQKELADRLHTSKATIWLWESGRQEPALRQWPRLIEFLGYDPRPKTETLGEQLKQFRDSRGWSQEQAALRLGIDRSVLWRWETGKRQPKGRYLAKVHAFLGGDPRPLPASLAEELKRCREKLGLTMAAGARRLHVAESTLCRWEAGDRQPAGEHLERVSALLQSCRF